MAVRSSFGQGQETKRKHVSLGVRAAQVFAQLLTRGDEPFQRYFLSAPRTTGKGLPAPARLSKTRLLRRATRSGATSPIGY